MNEKLATELQTYQKNFESLVGAYEGKFVVIHRERVLGAFDSQSDAIAWGYRELGNVPLLVKHVTRVETPLSFISNLLGV